VNLFWNFPSSAPHARLMIPINKQAGFSVHVNREVWMDALSLTVAVLVLADTLLIQVLQESALILESRVRSYEPD
jgi:hypothetical protein